MSLKKEEKITKIASIEREATPIKIETMTFPQAIMLTLDGKRIARMAWPKDEFAFLHEGYLRIHTRHQDFNWNINDGDLTAKDWIIL